MSANFSEKPQECSTPIRRFALASDSESTVINELSYDYDALELLSDAEDHGSKFTVTSQVWSIDSPDSEFNRQLANEFDQTLLSYSSASESSDLTEVFSEALSEIDTESTELLSEKDTESTDLLNDKDTENVDIVSNLSYELEYSDFVIGLPDNCDVEGCETRSSVSSDSNSDARPPTRVTMARSNKENYMKSYRQAGLVWSDTYEYMDKDTILPEDLESTILQISQYISGLHEVQLYFAEKPAPEYGAAELAETGELRAKAAALRAQLQKVLFEYKKHAQAQQKADADAAAKANQAAAAAQAAATAAAAVRSQQADQAAIDVAKMTISAMEPTLISTTDELITAMQSIRDTTATTPGEFKRLEAKYGEIEEDCATTVVQYQNLKAEAVTAGDTAAAQRFVDMMRKLADAQKLTVDHVRTTSADLGFLPGQSESVTKHLSLKPPVFSGVLGSDLDYFTFVKKLTDYFESIGAFSHHSMLVKLKSDCLAEPAASAIKDQDTYAAAMSELKRLYGQPRVLFSSKVKELKKLGKCPDSITETRVWAISMKNQVKSVSDLATTHKISSMFESSQVIEIVESLLKTRDQYKLKEKVREAMILDPDFDIEARGPRVKLILQYLDEMIDNATFEINYNMSKSYRATEATISGDKAKSSDKQNQKKAFVAAPAESAAGGCGQCCGKAKTAAFSSDAPMTTNKSKEPKGVMCKICEIEHTHLSYCEAYQRAENTNKFKMLCAVKACPRCLRMDAGFMYDNRKAWFNAHKPFCTDKFLCTEGECATRPSHFQNNVTLCPKHTDITHEQQDEYMKSLNSDLVTDGAKFYMNMHGVYSTPAPRPRAPEPAAEDGVVTVIEPDISDPAVYMLQMVPGPKNERLLMFYDSGCYMAAMSDRAYSVFDTTTVRPGPTHLDAAANSCIELEHGDEQFLLKLASERGVRRFATITALRMPKISSEFPVWPLMEAWTSLQAEYLAGGGGNGLPLPTVESQIGGESVDLMVGIQYQRYFPTLLFTLPSGLAIYRAQFAGCDGHQGVLGGPSTLWRDIAQQAHFMGPAAYFVSELRAHRMQCQSLKFVTALDEELLMPNDDITVECCEKRVYAAQSTNRIIRDMLMLDELGAEIDYRCQKCRNCYDCKNAEQIEMVSLQEEREQYLIEQCVTYDAESRVMVAKLPFLETTELRLTDNYFVAKKILEGQIRQAHRRPDAVQQIEASHNKLRERGFVIPLSELEPELRCEAEKAGYYIPWRTVQSDSLSTPTRMVFDASSKTSSGNSLNCMLAKGRNMLADMISLLVRFRFGSAAFCADVSMAYNGVRLHRTHLRYHKYLWTDGLVVGGAVIIMVILTLIYGVRPAGNLTMRAFELTAEVAEKDPVLAATGGPKCLKNSAYMDDVLAAFRTAQKSKAASQGLVDTLAISQMNVKAITSSGEAPCDKVSVDGKTINVVGYVWDPVKDVLSLDIKPLFFGKKIRGRRPDPVSGDVRAALAANFTRRELAGKLAAVYDPLGICVPVTARMKVCLREIVRITTDWDEKIPADKLDEWLEILQEIQQLGEVTVERSILEESMGDDVKFELVTCADASQTVAAAAVYLRAVSKNGNIKCGLLAAKSKLVSKLTIPRAELKACVMAVTLAEVVKRALKDDISACYYATDSVVALAWLRTDQRPLQVGVRNAVIEIRRFSDISQWFHISSSLNPADIGTRGPPVQDIMGDSVWQRGYPWMSLEFAEMPLKRYDDIEFSDSDKVAVNQEIRNTGLQGIVLNVMETNIAARYHFSNYIVDPCALPWPKFLRKVAVIVRVKRAFMTKQVSSELSPLQFPTFNEKLLICLSEEDLKLAQNYIFGVTSREVKKFHDVTKLKHVIEKEGILYYSGRILDGVGPRNLSDVAVDIQKSSFICPVLDRFSPVAYAIMIHAHVTLSHHGGVISTLRAAETIAFVIQGKKLAVEVRNDCMFCRRFKAKQEKAVIGGLPVERMTVAPAFYHVQIDLFGPLEAHCKHGRRSVVKIYGAVFKCMTTLAVAVNVMDSYDTATFLDSFYRFSSRYGVPAKVFIDSGTQLLAAFRNGDFSVVDVTQTLNQEAGVTIEFDVCPVNAHEAHGLVERAIKEVKRIFLAVFHGVKMDILRYETVFSWICNELNSLPLCLGSNYRDLEHSDLITPNRLLLGRNNKRAVGGLNVDCQPQNVQRQMEDVMTAWWDVWLAEKLGSLVPKPPKWETGEPQIEVGDVVVFVREKNDVAGLTWRLGLVDSVETGKDGVIRRVTIKYKVIRDNGDAEANFRFTRRSVRHVAVVVRENELDLMGRLSEAQKSAGVMFWRRGGVVREAGELHTGPAGGVGGDEARVDA